MLSAHHDLVALDLDLQLLGAEARDVDLVGQLATLVDVELGGMVTELKELFGIFNLLVWHSYSGKYYLHLMAVLDGETGDEKGEVNYQDHPI